MECMWILHGVKVDLWCNACKGTMENMWGVNAIEVVGSYMPFDGILMKFVWNINDARPTPQRTQMWVQAKNNGRGRSRGTLPSSQHFEG